MAGAYVTSWGNSNNSSTETGITVTVSGATANNWLVAVVVIRLGGDLFYTPSGWTEIYQDSTGGFGYALYRKLAAGTSADNFSPSWDDPGYPNANVAEFSGLDTTGNPEATNKDISNFNTQVTSTGTGSATPTSANGLAIAVLSAIDADAWETAVDGTGISISNSFVKKSFYTFADPPSARPLVGFATKNYSSTAAQSATWSTSGAGSRAVGYMLVFKDAGGGGPTFQSAWARGSNQIIQGVSS